VEFDIARRYRGGKPRMFVPPPSDGYIQDSSNWITTYVTDMNTYMTAFMAALEALSIGSMGTLAHVNCSFYHGKNTSTPPWRGPGYKYPPLYRSSVQVDTVVGYATKQKIGAQRRRIRASTP